MAPSATQVYNRRLQAALYYARKKNRLRRTGGGSGSRIPRAKFPTIIPIGDSRVPTFLDPATKRQKGATCLSNVACALADQRYTVKNGYGISGATVPTYLANLGAAIAEAPGVIFIPSVLNSLAAGVSGQAVAELILDAADQIIAADIICIVGSEIGSTALTPLQKVEADIYNAVIQQAAKTTQGLIYLELRTALALDGAPKVELRYDGGHLNQRGGLAGGEILKALLDVVMPAGLTFRLNAGGVPLIGGYTNLALNPRFQVITGGATSTGATGTFAGSCNFNLTGAGTALAVTTTAGRVRMACTFGGQNHNCRMSTAALSAAYAAGDLVRGMAVVEVSTPNGLAGVQLTLVANLNTGVTTWTDMFATATWAGPATGYHMLMLTQEYAIPAHATKNSLALTIQANSYAAGAGTVVDAFEVGILKKAA